MRESNLPTPAAYRSLALLARLRLTGQWRKLKRTFATPKGAVLGVVMLISLGMMLGPQFFARRLPPEAGRAIAETLLHPALLLLMWLFTFAGSWLKSPIAFTMPEVDFLFAGPFARRQLLLYKLVLNAIAVPGLALAAPLFIPFASWPAAMLGIGLLAVFVQWSSVLGNLAISWIGTRHRLTASLIALSIAALVPISLWQAGAFAPRLVVRERMQAIESSWIAQAALAPFAVFSYLLRAEKTTALVAWTAIAAGMIALVALAILRLDAYFVEASLGASRRRYEVLERLRRSGGTSAFRLRSRPRSTLPQLPRLRGAGPIAWRQGLEILRSAGGWLTTLLFPAAVGLVVGLLIRFGGGDRSVDTVAIVSVTLGIGLLMMIGLPLALRSDLNHIDAIKGLPVGALAIVSGSIAAATAYVSLVQAIAAIVMAGVTGTWIPAVPLGVALAVCLNLLSIAFDSVLVLLFPSMRQFLPGDPFAGIRLMLANLARMLFAGVTVSIAAAVVLLARLVVGPVPAVLVSLGCVVVAVEALATIWVAAALFERFDASAHGLERE